MDFWNIVNCGCEKRLNEHFRACVFHLRGQEWLGAFLIILIFPFLKPPLYLIESFERLDSQHSVIFAHVKLLVSFVKSHCFLLISSR